jgi:hypothetical protein
MWFFQGATSKPMWRRENNEKKKEKQTCVDPTCMGHHGRKKHRDESNDTAEAWLISLYVVACIARRWWNGWRVLGTDH